MTEIDNKPKMEYDLAIAYRVYPGVSKVPPVHNDNKYKLSELCLASFKSSIEGLKVKLWALLDGCPSEYEALFRKYFDDDELEVINLEGIGNAGTFSLQMDILSEQEYSNYIYFAEDDYFYLPGSFIKMLDLIRNNDEVSFVSPFDHLDYYTLELHKHPVKQIEFQGNKWRESATTCMTFLTTKDELKRSANIFRSYTKGNYDASIWLSLTKYRILDPGFYFHAIFSEFLMFKILGKAWLYTLSQIIFGSKFRLVTPLPSIATHMDSECLAPGIDWISEFSKTDII